MSIALKVLENEMKQNIKPEDEVTITITYADLAKVYAILGSVNGKYSSSIWSLAKATLDPDREVYDGFIKNKSYEDLHAYYEYQDEWENLLFP